MATKLAVMALVLASPVQQMPSSVRWGVQRPDLVRYNRVEALSIGARAQIRPLVSGEPLSVGGTVRLGVADLEPNVRVEFARESFERSLTLAVYHELAALDEAARHLGVGNSLLAALFGRDDGDYYRRSGISFELRPPAATPTGLRVLAYGEYHQRAPPETDFALLRSASSSFSFRPGLPADEGWEFGGVIDATPRWGRDPSLIRGGFDVRLQGALGESDYLRSSLTAHVFIPLPARWSVGLEGAAGTSWGDPTVQRLWYVGGWRTLRGYDPLILGGGSYGRTRAELARAAPFGKLALFADLAWAGERGGASFEDALHSAGLGVSLLDGLIRLDGAYGLRSPRDFRLDAYVSGSR